MTFHCRINLEHSFSLCILNYFWDHNLSIASLSSLSFLETLPRNPPIYPSLISFTLMAFQLYCYCIYTYTYLLEYILYLLYILKYILFSPYKATSLHIFRADNLVCSSLWKAAIPILSFPMFPMIFG